jgi:glycosyltransferase involved in cell wall biosynthesis
MKQPLISVALITYNQIDFVRETLDGILSQERTGFDLEIIAGDDCSTDGTREAISEYRYKYPDIIRISERKSNLGMHGNWEATFADCKGELIAIIEGDDRWDDPKKLQKQVDLLNENPDASACFSNAKVLREDGTFSDYDYVDRYSKNLSAEQFFSLNFNPIPTCTLLFRAVHFNSFPKTYHESPFADWILHALLVQKGNYVYLNECSSTYRQHGGGVWSGVQKELQLTNKLKVLNIISGLVRREFNPLVVSATKKQLDDLLYFYREEGETAKYIRTWIKLKLA